MSNPRSDRIDSAVSGAGELIGLLQVAGPINGAQARLIIEAAVRATVPNFESWEIRDSAGRIAAELEGLGKNENHASDVR
jgi:hypothetical protein